jgi:ribosomal 50S subunit-recycling heat shock protein
MRLITTIAAAALLLPALAGARSTVEPATKGDQRIDPRLTANRGNFRPGAEQTIGQGRSIVMNPSPVRVGKVVANDEKTLTLRTASADETFDVRRLAFSHSVNPGDSIQINLSDDQRPISIRGTDDSASAAPIAAEPTP